MNRPIIFLSGLLTFILSSCSTLNKSSYTGDYYAPTYEVNIYYEEEDIPLDYKVIGNAKNSSYRVKTLTPAQLRDVTIREAMNAGADAVLVTTTVPSKNNNGSKIVESIFLRFKDYQPIEKQP